jgi:hypothetical protein
MQTGTGPGSKVLEWRTDQNHTSSTTRAARRRAPFRSATSGRAGLLLRGSHPVVGPHEACDPVQRRQPRRGARDRLHAESATGAFYLLEVGARSASAHVVTDLHLLDPVDEVRCDYENHYRPESRARSFWRPQTPGTTISRHKLCEASPTGRWSSSSPVTISSANSPRRLSTSSWASLRAVSDRPVRARFSKSPTRGVSRAARRETAPNREAPVRDSHRGHRGSRVPACRSTQERRTERDMSPAS